MPTDAVDRSINALGVLDEPTRRRLYLFVRAAGHAVTRDEAAEHTGISRKLAAFHLDRLVDAHLLVPGPLPHPAERRRGRARKTYEPSGVALDVSIPPRHYDLAGELLASAIQSCGAGERPTAAARRVAFERGRRIGDTARPRARSKRSLETRKLVMLADQGYEPMREGDRIVLRSCPFDAVARSAPELVCGMNQALLEGALRGIGDAETEAILEPVPGRCCVELRATS
jgi:predicted ArsR family transcriptional regulator